MCVREIVCVRMVAWVFQEKRHQGAEGGRGLGGNGSGSVRGWRHSRCTSHLGYRHHAPLRVLEAELGKRVCVRVIVLVWCGWVRVYVCVDGWAGVRVGVGAYGLCRVCRERARDGGVSGKHYVRVKSRRNIPDILLERERAHTVGRNLTCTHACTPQWGTAGARVRSVSAAHHSPPARTWPSKAPPGATHTQVHMSKGGERAWERHKHTHAHKRERERTYVVP